MIVHRISLEGILRTFGPQRRVEVDLDGLPHDGALVAWVGKNGSGKSHLIETCLPAVAWQEWSYYGVPFAAHMLPDAKRAIAESWFSVGGKRYRARIQADRKGKSIKTEGLLWVAGAEKPIAGPLVTDYARRIAEILPSKELAYLSVFASQGGRGGFWKLKPAERRDAFAEMVGCAHFQALAEESRAKATEVLRALEDLRRRRADAEARAARAASLDREIVEVSEALAARQEEHAAAEERVNVVTDRVTKAREQLARATDAAKAAAEERARLEAEEKRYSAAKLAAEGKLAGALALVGQREAIEGAASEVAMLESQLEKARKEERRLAEALRPVEEDVTRKEGELAVMRTEYAALTKDWNAATDAGERARGYEGLAGEVHTFEAEASRTEKWAADLEAATAAFEAAAKAEGETAALRSRLAERLRDLRPRIAALSEINLEHPMCSVCPLTADARGAKEAVSGLEADLGALGKVDGTPAADALRTHRTAVADAGNASRRAAQALADGRVRLSALAADRKAAEGSEALCERRAEVLARGQALQAVLAAFTAERNDLRNAVRAARDRREECEKRLAGVRPLASKLADLRAAEARAEELRTAIQTAIEASAAIADRLAELPAETLPDVGLPGLEKALEEALRFLRSAAANVRTVSNSRAALEGERRSLGDAGAVAAALGAEESALVTDASDWALLETTLGREGVQALELDAAAPGVSMIANDILSNCYGSRFALALETLAEKKTGGQKEVFQPRIIDAELGSIDLGSGGEMVVIEEALRIAVALYQAERSGFELRTLFRDETGQALSPDHADAYIAMLRRAAALGKFEQVHFISHSAEAWRQADARIFLVENEREIAGERRPGDVVLAWG